MSRDYGFLRITAAVPRIVVANPAANVEAMLAMLGSHTDSDVVLFPELSISAYSCGELFHQQALLAACEQQLARLCEAMPNPDQLLLAGLPLRAGNALYNVVVAVNRRRPVGVIPKVYVPNYNEFYEARYFASGRGPLPATVPLMGEEVPFGTRLLHTHDCGGVEAVIHVEVCESIWMPVPSSSLASLAGANVLLNPSASPETIGKAGQRRQLVVSQSSRCLAAYAYAGSGPTESTADLVFGGHALLAQGGHLLSESSRVGDGAPPERHGHAITADVDVQRLQADRRRLNTFSQPDVPVDAQVWHRLPITLHDSASRGLGYRPAALPFVPKDPATLADRCAEIFGIQTAALAKRLECLPDDAPLSIGVSGGLDSTLALLVATRTCDLIGRPRTTIRALTMPGFGTSDHTLGNARRLMDQLGVARSEIDIRAACLQEFQDLASVIGYQPFGQVQIDDHPDLDTFLERLRQVPETDHQDLTFENVQARRRTELLMNLGFVLGTGDLSELWLGWCTYNADHQSMYNVNCSIPKTLVRFLVEYVAEHEFEGEVRNTLMSVAATEISPELLPVSDSGDIRQRTEDVVGPYELHDFFLFNLVRYGFTPEKVRYLAGYAEGWSRDYTDKEIAHWLDIALRRAFAQQYKRDDVPNGPKVGSISLSPRGDWRMPSDASPGAWLA